MAIWDISEKKLIKMQTSTILATQMIILELLKDGQEFFLIIEDARQRKYFKGVDMDAQAQGAGSIKRDCSIWEEFCDMHDLEYQMKPPRNTKIDKRMFDQFAKYEGRSGEHARDAAMLVLGINEGYIKSLRLAKTTKKR